MDLPQVLELRCARPPVVFGREGTGRQVAAHRRPMNATEAQELRSLALLEAQENTASGGTLNGRPVKPGALSTVVEQEGSASERITRAKLGKGRRLDFALDLM